MYPKTLAVVLFGILVAAFVDSSSAGEHEKAWNEFPRLEICINGRWQWVQSDSDVFHSESATIRVPGAHQPDDDTSEVCQWYRRELFLPSRMQETRARWFLRFEKAGWYTRVIVNGTEVGENFGSINAFEFDVTDALHWGKENDIRVFVHVADASHTLPNKIVNNLLESTGYRAGGRPFRNWAQIAGDVFLEKRPAVRINWHRVDTSVRQGKITVRGELTAFKKGQQLRASIVNLETHETVLEMSAGADTDFSLTADWKNPVLWGFGPYGKPALYGMRLELLSAKGVLLDAVVSRFGFREVWYEGQKLMLNGKELIITAATIPLGLDRRVVPYMHPYGVYERNQLTRMVQTLRKYGWNGIHNHFDTYGNVLYDVADELGTLVIGGAYCSGPQWLTAAVKTHPDYPNYMHHQLAEWVKSVGGHSSIVMWSLVDGVPASTDRWPLKAILDAINVESAVHQTDTTRPIVGCDTDYIKQGVGAIRQEAEANFHDNGRPRFIKEVWSINANDGSVRDLRGLLDFMEQKQISGFASFGEILPPMAIHVDWPSESGEGTRWDPKRAGLGFYSWLNWCDLSQPIHRPSDVGEELGQQYRQRWGSPGAVEPMVYPHVLSEGHASDAIFLSVMALSPLSPTPKLVLIDQKAKGYVHIRYPGLTLLTEVGRQHDRTKTIDAQKIRLPAKAGYQDIIDVQWDD